MAWGQGTSSFETGTNPVAVVCLQLAGSAGAYPEELTVPGGERFSKGWDVGNDNRDSAWVLEPLLTVGESLAEK